MNLDGGGVCLLVAYCGGLFSCRGEEGEIGEGRDDDQVIY